MFISISQGTDRSWVHFHLQKMRKTKQALPLNSRLKTVKMAVANVWRPCVLCNQATGGMVGSHLNHLPVISRWCDSLGDAALCETGWLVHQKVDDGMRGRETRFERYYSTTRGCGTGNVWERLWNLKHIWKNMKNIIYWFFEEKFGQGEISTFWSFCMQASKDLVYM